MGSDTTALRPWERVGDPDYMSPKVLIWATLLGRARRPSSEVSGVGALVGVTELVRAESDLPTVLSLIARTVAEVLGFETVVLNLYRREWDDFCVTTVEIACLKISCS